MVQIHTEVFDNEAILFPCYILGKENKLIPVFNGHNVNDKSSSEDGLYGVFVRDIDYNKIDYTKPLVLIHDADIQQKDVQEMIDSSKILEDLEGNDYVHISRLKKEDCEISELILH